MAQRTIKERVETVEHTLHGNGAIGLITQVRIIMYLVIAITVMMLILVGERFVQVAR